MLNFLFVLLAALPAGAAEDPLAAGWQDIPTQCIHWDLKSTEDFAKLGLKWDHRYHDAQDNLVRVTKDVCPKYLESANGASAVDGKPVGMTLEKFIAELQRVYADVSSVKDGAEKHKAYLDTSIAKLQAFFGEGGWDIKDHPCGARFLERRNYIAAELKRFEKNVNDLRTKCPAAADANMARAAEKGKTAVLEKAKGKGGADMVPTGRTKNEGSDITGTKPKQPETK